MHTNQNPYSRPLVFIRGSSESPVPTTNRRECTRIRTPHSPPLVFVVVHHSRQSQPRIDANAHESEPPLFASIGVHSWFIRVASPNHESTRMHTNQNPLFASISVHSWFIRVASPNHESTRMHTNQNPLFASISVHSWFIRGRQVSTSEKSIGILRFFSRSAATGYRFFAVLPE
jgi:hypothetical protein